MIDFHCHLDLYPNALSILDEVERRNEFTLVVTTSPRAYIATSRVFSGRKKIHVGLGLHPEVATQKQAELEQLVSLVSSARFVGEIGLDGSSRFESSLTVQTKIFNAVVEECQAQGGRIMSIHSRGAESRVLDVLESFPGAGTPVLHWFSGSRRELLRAIDMGCWFSVGPAMLAADKGKKLLSEMPFDRLLPETDGPFTRLKDGPLMPWDAHTISGHLMHASGKPQPAIELLLRGNLDRLLMKATRP